jgi:hypothetical protein
MITHKILGIAAMWRCSVIAIPVLMAFIALATFAPSRVYFHTTHGPLSQDEREDCSRFAVFFPGVKETEIEVTKIADLDGSLWEWTGARLDLVFVRSGVAQCDECQELIGTSGGRLDHPFFRYRMSPHVVLARANIMKYGRFAVLGSFGGPTSGSKGPTHAPSQPARVKRGYDRNITWSKKEIVYVEGGEEPVVYPGMSLEEFCNRNDRGEYLVVIASLR